jgi:hypothetical protein
MNEAEEIIEAKRTWYKDADKMFGALEKPQPINVLIFH